MKCDHGNYDSLSTDAESPRLAGCVHSPAAVLMMGGNFRRSSDWGEKSGDSDVSLNLTNSSRSGSFAQMVLYDVASVSTIRVQIMCFFYSHIHFRLYQNISATPLRVHSRSLLNELCRAFISHMVGLDLALTYAMDALDNCPPDCRYVKNYF